LERHPSFQRPISSILHLELAETGTPLGAHAAVRQCAYMHMVVSSIVCIGLVNSHGRDYRRLFIGEEMMNFRKMV